MDRAALDALVDTMEHEVGPRNGARVIARARRRRAWTRGQRRDDGARSRRASVNGNATWLSLVVGCVSTALGLLWGYPLIERLL